MNASEVIPVAAGVLRNARGEILLAKRPDHVHKGGLWEFPGGKIERGESAVQALRRELHEELGIEVTRSHPLIQVLHHYPERSVMLDVHLVEMWQNEPHGREGQPLAWVAPQALDHYPMPEADRPIMQAIQLPSLYLITPAQIESVSGFMKTLEQALNNGIRLVQFRVFDLEKDLYRQMLRDAEDLCARYEARLLVNTGAENARQLGAGGLHLNSRELARLQQRPAAIDLLAASCHTLQDLQKAEALAVDFALLSPVLPTRSHPDADPLGWEGFRDLVAQVNIPVYALGGMSPAHVDSAREQGGQGIAAIRGLWPG